jgi:hypothetical protein
MKERGAVCFKNSEGSYSRSLYSKWAGPVLPFLMKDFLEKAGKLSRQSPEELIRAFYRWIVDRSSPEETARYYNLQEFSKTASYELGNWVVSYDAVSGKLLGYHNLETNLEFDGKTEGYRREEQKEKEILKAEESRIQYLTKSY